MSEWGRRDRGTFLYYVVMEREDWGHGVVGRLSLIITLHKTGTQVFNNLSFFSRSCVCGSARRMVCTLHRKGAGQGPILLTREWRRGGRAGHARTRAQSQSAWNLHLSPAACRPCQTTEYLWHESGILDGYNQTYVQYSSSIFIWYWWCYLNTQYFEMAFKPVFSICYFL